MEAIAQQASVTIDKQQHNAQVARAVLWDKRLLLAKPTTFMNNSGQSVLKLVQYYKVCTVFAAKACMQHAPACLPSW